MRLGLPGWIIILDLILGLGLGLGLVVVVLLGVLVLMGDLILPAQMFWVASQILFIVSRVGAVS